MTPPVQPCCFAGCGNQGAPEPGRDFYACPRCLHDLEMIILDKIHRAMLKLDTAIPNPGEGQIQ